MQNNNAKNKEESRTTLFYGFVHKPSKPMALFDLSN
jgi:hypothetical protein